MSEKSYTAALNEALSEAMEADGRVFLLGEDIQVGMFGVTRGLVKKFGEDRVRNTPISEAAMAGASVGAAIMGMRPVLEIGFADILGISFDHIVQSAAKARYIYAGKGSCPLVIRAPMGIGMGYGMHHSQSVESWFLNVPGLVVVTPSTPYDAKGLLHAAIQSNDPVIFLEHKKLYSARGEVPDEPYAIPLGKGEVKREGDDLTIVATSFMVTRALEAAELLKAEGIEAEVVDPRSLKPLDSEIILNSVKKTGRAMIVHEAPKFGGFGGEVAAIIVEEALDYLEAPLARVAGKEIPIPFGIEEAAVPQVEDIVSCGVRLAG